MQSLETRLLIFVLRHVQINHYHPIPSWHTCNLFCIPSISLTRAALLSFLLLIGLFPCFSDRKNTCAECVWQWAGCLIVTTELRCVYYVEPTENRLRLNQPKPGWSAKCNDKSLPDAEEPSELHTCLYHHKYRWVCLEFGEVSVG